MKAILVLFGCFQNVVKEKGNSPFSSKKKRNKGEMIFIASKCVEYEQEEVGKKVINVMKMLHIISN